MRGPFDGEWQSLQEPLNSVLCHQWETKNGELLKELKVYLTIHPTLSDGRKSSPETKQLWSSDCPRVQRMIGSK